MRMVNVSFERIRGSLKASPLNDVVLYLRDGKGMPICLGQSAIKVHDGVVPSVVSSRLQAETS